MYLRKKKRRTYGSNDASGVIWAHFGRRHPNHPSFLLNIPQDPLLLLLSCASGCVVVVVAAWLLWLHAEADSEHVMNKFKLHY